MKFLYILLVQCMNCSHYVPVFCGYNWELSECKKYGRHADMCRMDEGKCGKEGRHFSPKKDAKKTDGTSMELDCM